MHTEEDTLKAIFIQFTGYIKYSSEVLQNDFVKTQ